MGNPTLPCIKSYRLILIKLSNMAKAIKLFLIVSIILHNVDGNEIGL